MYFVACLSSFILAIGGNEYWLPCLVLLAGIAGFNLSDLRPLLRLGNWTSNAILLLVVFFTFGNIIQYRGEGLALSIARVVIFVQIVLFFKEKTPRNCWHILILSFLQVVVASVFPQHSSYAVLLILYVFASLCAFCLIFLYRENLYFQRHTFRQSRQIRMETKLLIGEQDRRRLLKIVLATLLTGPIAFFLSFNDRKEGVKEPAGGNGKRRHWDVDSFWEDDLVEPREDQQTEEECDRTFSPVATRNRFVFPTFRATPALPAPTGRWSLLTELPRFSGGTQRNGMLRGQWALYARLAKWTFFSLVFAVIVFLLFPRFNGIDLFGIQFTYDRWTGGTSTVGGVGFTENVRLGSLGTVLQRHEEIMSVSFVKGVPRNKSEFHPYEQIEDNTAYFRGVVLNHYGNGIWNYRFAEERLPFDSRPAEWNRRTGQETRGSFGRGARRTIDTSPWMQPGTTLNRQWIDEIRYVPGCDPVTLVMKVQPLNTDVLFTPWPFWQSPMKLPREIYWERGLFQSQRLVRRSPNREPVHFAVCTTSFGNGVQLPLTPNQEPFSMPSLTQLPGDVSTSLPTLTALATRWDAESHLPKNDVIGRARFLESKLAASGTFRYRLGGVIRQSGLDPIEDFIRNNPEGHCEYFASALALMLRSVGIGSRIVVGFKIVCSKGENGTYFVRQSDAHSWVEAYIPPDSLAGRPETGNWQPEKRGEAHWEEAAWTLEDDDPFHDERAIPGNPPEKWRVSWQIAQKEVDADDPDTIFVLETMRRLLDPARPARETARETPRKREDTPSIPSRVASWWDRGGWLRLDPTPDSPDMESQHMRFHFRHLPQFIRSSWNEYVLNMSPGKQATFIYRPLSAAFGWFAKHVFRIDYWKRLLPEMWDAYKRFFQELRHGQWKIGATLLLLGPPILLGIVLLGLLRLVYRVFRNRLFSGIRNVVSDRRATVQFYRRLEKILAKFDMHRAESQTQAVFLRECALRLPQPVPLETVAEAFYRVRFGRRQLDDGEVAEIETTLERLAEMLKTKDKHSV